VETCADTFCSGATELIAHWILFYSDPAASVKMTVAPSADEKQQQQRQYSSDSDVEFSDDDKQSTSSGSDFSWTWHQLSLRRVQGLSRHFCHSSLKSVEPLKRVTWPRSHCISWFVYLPHVVNLYHIWTGNTTTTNNNNYTTHDNVYGAIIVM